ncbi:predicted protein [Histoplasma capsulatum G186AR]|uniref:Uncharacterized protein n=1 Tax=Ajellomyces capsulatus (strain G186AR / H82 / ATCC MYA-2454 / RMSCC 2432) TaxID=447093 RepID=C0P0R6_AJECG|nr:uncharacterized protein HCBG_08996 [Histoplasma capsulatum G186AR]EEH02716.1 predicted protein [Histoplasma capsulatum G186AR]
MMPTWRAGNFPLPAGSSLGLAPLQPRVQPHPGSCPRILRSKSGRRTDSNIRTVHSSFRVAELSHCARPHSMDHEYLYERPIGGGDMPQAAPDSSWWIGSAEHKFEDEIGHRDEM